MDIENTQQEQESPDTTNAAEVSRDDLIAAAREAVSGIEPGEGVAPTTPAAVPAPVAEAVPDPEERINSVLRAREAAHKQRLEAETHATTLRRQAEAEGKRIIEEARAEAKRLAENEVTSLREKWRASPTEALRSLADNPQDIVDAVLREGSPEARAMAKLTEDARAAREEAKAGKTVADELRAELTKDREERARAAADGIRNQFLSEHASSEKAPYMHARWDPGEVFDRCNSLCIDWQKDGLTLGKDFDQRDLVAYLEKQSKERFSKLTPSTSAQQSGVGSGSRDSSVAQKSGAAGTRTISTASSSERRASPKAFHEMTPEEQRADLVQVAREAMRPYAKP